MNNLMLSFSGSELSKLRALVDAVEQQIRLVPAPAAAGGAPAPKSTLDANWSKLVEMLDLGTEPALQTCPQCHALGMAGASLCSHCWSRFPAVAAKPARTAAGGDGGAGRAAKG